ncbi:MAG: histidine phosphatase family protein [Alphaproteobacteria bacterium]
MAKIYMVRHGEAAASWGDHKDPGLSDLGKRQAEAAADRLESLGKLPILSSPLLRCQETAAPLATRWRVKPLIEQHVAELPSPEDQEDRATWLRGAMQGPWSDLDPLYQNWAKSVADFIETIQEDTVIFSHFIAINVVLGRVTGSERVVTFAPNNCSITIFGNDSSGLSLIERGDEAETKIN